MKKVLEYLKGVQYEYIVYVMIFWFFNKVGEAYRLTPSKDLITKLMGSMTGLGNVMTKLLPSLNRFDLLVGFAGTVMIFLVVLYKKKNAKKWRKDVEYGSARWGDG